MNANQVMNFVGKWVAVGFCGFFGWQLGVFVLGLASERL